MRSRVVPDTEDSPRLRGPSIDVEACSTSYRRMLDWVRRVARCELPVLVRGESGSGKERVSREIHDRSNRCEGSFVAVNCTAIPETLLEAELFGALRGAYTGSERDRPGLFREAHGGTLFLDEVGDMPASMQAKLLRVLESRTVRPVGDSREYAVDARIIAATHRDLARRVARAEFRADLFYRLSVLEVRVPPLRDRLADLPLIVESLAPRLARETGASRIELTDRAWLALRAHNWPGNVRELHAVLARALLDTEGGTIRSRHIRGTNPHSTSAEPGTERCLIETALKDTDGCIASAADRIGWTRQKLYRRMNALSVKR